MSSTNIKTAIDLGIISLKQASVLLKQEISAHESEVKTQATKTQ